MVSILGQFTGALPTPWLGVKPQPYMHRSASRYHCQMLACPYGSLTACDVSLLFFEFLNGNSCSYIAISGVSQGMCIPPSATGLIKLHTFTQREKKSTRKAALQSSKFAGYLQTNNTIEINCSQGVTEHQCKYCKITNIKFSSQ